MRVPYIVNTGEAFGESTKKRKIAPAILSCALGTGIGIGFQLVLAANPGIIASLLSSLKDLGMAIWTMFCNAIRACTDFVHYVMHTGSG
jgi:predicted membrane metal-binding protein